MITIVTSPICGYCSAAKSLITSLGYEYKEVQVEMGSNKLMEVVSKTGLMSVPQIFSGEISKENLLGGYSDIEKLNNEGKLVEILEANK